MTKAKKVYLLLEDLQEAKELSQVFRKAGTLPYVYESLQKFWYAALNDLPVLTVVDVKMMSAEDLILKNHPRVKDLSLPLVFYYSDETRPLLLSTYHLFHYGYIKKDMVFPGGTRGLLDRVARNQKIILENLALKKELVHTKGKVSELLSTQQLERQQGDSQHFLERLAQGFEKEEEKSHFFHQCINVFSDTPEITEFSFMELNRTGHKLVSPLSGATKFKNIPSLWLGQACLSGIEKFGEDMAIQVATDILGEDVRMMRLMGAKPMAEALLFIKGEKEFLPATNTLERMFSGYYARARLHQEDQVSTDENQMSPWDFLSLLDEYVVQGKDEDYVLIDIDFTELQEKILKKAPVHFYWKHFYHEFLASLRNQLIHEHKVVCIGVHRLVFIVSRKNNASNEFFSLVKSLVSKFSYWRYFEDSEAFLSNQICPRVTMMPVSSFLYLKILGNVDRFQQERKPKESSRPVIQVSRQNYEI